jgi:hypothetical protein
MIEDIYIRLTGFRSIIVGRDEDGIDISLHVLGGHLMSKLTQTEGLELLEALKTVLEAEQVL